MSDTKEKVKSVPLTSDPHHFDLPRLAEEVHKVFEGEVVEATTHIKEAVDSLKTQKEEIIQTGIEVQKAAKDGINLFTQAAGKATEENIEYYKKKAGEVVTSIKDDLIAEINKGRTEIYINDVLTITTTHLDHPEYENVLQSLYIFKKSMLVGPAGTGKTYMIADMAIKMGLPFYKYSCSRDSSVHDLLGYKQPTSETYLETVFLKAYENGGVFLVDESDAMSGDMALFFNGVADNSEFISVPHRDTNPTAKRHKDFYIVFCGNTWGKGSHEFSGRDFQDQALLDRFRVCKHYIHYHIQLEKSLCDNAGIPYNQIELLREKMEKIGSYLSTRNVEDICKLFKSKWSSSVSGNEKYRIIVEKMTKDLSDSEKSIVYDSLH